MRGENENDRVASPEKVPILITKLEFFHEHLFSQIRVQVSEYNSIFSTFLTKGNVFCDFLGNKTLPKGDQVLKKLQQVSRGSYIPRARATA